jgi:hypothetical protein
MFSSYAFLYFIVCLGNRQEINISEGIAAWWIPPPSRVFSFSFFQFQLKTSKVFMLKLWFPNCCPWLRSSWQLRILLDVNLLQSKELWASTDQRIKWLTTRQTTRGQSLRKTGFFLRPHRLWGPPGFLHSRYRETLPQRQKGRSVQLTIHMNLIQTLRIRSALLLFLESIYTLPTHYNLNLKFCFFVYWTLKKYV